MLSRKRTCEQQCACEHADNFYSVLYSLLQTVSYDEARRLVKVEEEAIVAMAAVSGDSGTADASNVVKAVADYLSYLRAQWLPRAIWSGWSRRGREDAAIRMGVGIDAILTTTNHLESLNGRLKNYYIPQWQHSGRRLRLDVLIYFLIADILPRIYGQHRLLTNYSAWKVARFHSASGGTLTMAPSPTELKRSRTDVIPRAWYEPDFRRDTDARMLYTSGFIKAIRSGRRYELWASCASSSGLGGRLTEAPARLEGDPIGVSVYLLTVHPSGAATCTCLDWMQRGGACKHLRAFRLLIEHWGSSGNLQVPYLFPSTAEEAEKIEYQNRQWYGTAYIHAVTTPGGLPTSGIGLEAGHSASTTLPPYSLEGDVAARFILPPRHLDNPSTSIQIIQQYAELEDIDHDVGQAGVPNERDNSSRPESSSTEAVCLSLTTASNALSNSLDTS